MRFRDWKYFVPLALSLSLIARARAAAFEGFSGPEIRNLVPNNDSDGKPSTMSSSPENTVRPAKMCFNSRDVPTLKWHRRIDGEYEAILSLDVVNVELEGGTMRTFGYNGMIPGPLMRMKPCGVYHLTLVNNLEGWNEGSQEPMNSYRYPTNTNIHLHGMHISGLPPGDDVFNMLEAGETGEYIYTIPCDHSGGTNWYHPHSHGSSSLQLAGGAAGMIVVESSPIEAQDMPMEIQAMPEQFLVIQDFNIAKSVEISGSAGDSVFNTTIENDFTLINGCENAVILLEAGQWTRLHILHAGMMSGAVISVSAIDSTSVQCDIGLLAKDGVWLAEVPRMLSEDNKMYFSHSSRVDVAIRCHESGIDHYISYIHVFDDDMAEPRIIGTIKVLESAREPAGELVAWSPCRPAYLMDLNNIYTDELSVAFPIEFQNGKKINGGLYAGPDEIFHDIGINEVQIWSLTGSDAHPVHLHVNHMQIDRSINSTNSFSEVPGWHVAGDWVDTYSGPGTALVRVRPERFIGPMILHCHIVAHEDTGMMAVVSITGDGADAETEPVILNYGTCPERIPKSKPYKSLPAVIPGIIEAEEFDFGGEGVAYHNINYASLTASHMRVDESVEILSDGNVVSVGQIFSDEYLKYSVNVMESGFYKVSITQSSESPLEGMQFSLWVGLTICPPPNQSLGFLGRFYDPNFKGTGNYSVYQNISLVDSIDLKEGLNTLLVCFEVNSYMQLDSITFEHCGTAACNASDDDDGSVDLALSFKNSVDYDAIDDKHSKSVWEKIADFF